MPSTTWNLLLLVITFTLFTLYAPAKANDPHCHLVVGESIKEQTENAVDKINLKHNFSK